MSTNRANARTVAKDAQTGLQLHIGPGLGRELLQNGGADAVERPRQVRERLLPRGAALL